MSIHWIDRVWKQSQQKGGALLFMLAIADSANDDGLAWPGQDHLAAKTRMTGRNLIYLERRCERDREIAIVHGGQGAKHTNRYYLLLGRSDAEINRLKQSLKTQSRKGEKISPRRKSKGEKSSKGEKISLKNPANKGEVGFTRSIITNDQAMNEWMNDDPIGPWLRALPGYNPFNIESDRQLIIEHGYDPEALRYLWDHAQERAQALNYDNPIGLLLKMVETDQQSPAFLELLAERRRQQEVTANKIQRLADLEQRRAIEPDAAPHALHVDDSVNQPIGTSRMTPLQVWQAAQGELQLQMTHATYTTWVKPTILVSVNGTWKIGVPNAYSHDWWENRLKTTVKRVLTGIVGTAVEPEFVIISRGEV